MEPVEVATQWSFVVGIRALQHGLIMNNISKPRDTSTDCLGINKIGNVVVAVPSGPMV